MIDLLFFILIFLFLCLIWGFFILKLVKAHKPLAIEKGKKLLHSFTSGGRIGRIRYTPPFINLRIYDEFIVIASFKVIILRYEEIDRVEIKKWMDSIPREIKLVHHKWNAPQRIVIGTNKPNYLKEIIESRLPKNQ